MSIEIAHNLTGHQSLIKPEEVKELKHDSLFQVAKKLEIPKYMWPFLLYRGRRQMNKRLGEIKPFSGMEQVLSELHKAGYRLFIISTNSSANIATFLASHGLGGYIEKIYGGIGLLNKSGALRKVMPKNKLPPSYFFSVGAEFETCER